MNRTLACVLVMGISLTAAAESPDVVVAKSSPRIVDAAPARAHARDRLIEIQRRIQAALRYPPAARSREIEGTALLRFDIDASGTPREIVVHGSAGLASLDRAATAAVSDAAPLPWVYGRLEVPIVFELDRRK